MRTYGQYCSIARALDVVGDRWTLLIVRELVLQAPCRFTDLKRGLPGVATNLLSTRLKELEEAGLIVRSEAPPPVATALYDLTDDGRALQPVLRSLGLWGLRLMDDERPGEAFQAQWLAYAPLWFTTDAEPSGPPAAIQLVADGEMAAIELRDGHITTRVGAVSEPDLTIEGSASAVLGLVMGLLDTKGATARGITLRGRRQLLKRLGPTPSDRAAREDTSRSTPHA
ncbi:MAG TPA: helix-turn-helix domain-containing protein [Nocardioides sp.]|nr:helix-turn-helix domain-containing protein [Nocardioides sp.]